MSRGLLNLQVPIKNSLPKRFSNPCNGKGNLNAVYTLIISSNDENL